MTRTVVKAFLADGSVAFYASLSECCQDFGIRYKEDLRRLIDKAGLAPDGKTFFDYPTEAEMKDIEDGKITLIFNARRRKK